MSKKNEAFDLASIDTVAACNGGFEVELKHPVTQAPLGIFWKVVGSESDAFKEHIKENINARIRQEASAKKRGKELPVRTIEEIESDGIDLLLVCSLGWRSTDSATIPFEGQQLEFNIPNARKVLTRLPWVKAQIDEAIGDLENFMKI